MVEIMADTAVALASANVQLVSKKVIGRMCRVRLMAYSSVFMFNIVLYICWLKLFFFTVVELLVICRGITFYGLQPFD